MSISIVVSQILLALIVLIAAVYKLARDLARLARDLADLNDRHAFVQQQVDAIGGARFRRHERSAEPIEAEVVTTPPADWPSAQVVKRRPWSREVSAPPRPFSRGRS